VTSGSFPLIDGSGRVGSILRAVATRRSTSGPASIPAFDQLRNLRWFSARLGFVMLLRFCRNLDDMEDLLRTGGRTIRLRLMSSADGLILDPKRSGKWTTSFWDVNFDETFPLKGLHPDGKLMPTSYLRRCGEGQRPVRDFKCA
jgi:hypothetical protein